MNIIFISLLLKPYHTTNTFREFRSLLFEISFDYLVNFDFVNSVPPFHLPPHIIPPRVLQDIKGSTTTSRRFA